MLDEIGEKIEHLRLDGNVFAFPLTSRVLVSSTYSSKTNCRPKSPGVMLISANQIKRHFNVRSLTGEAANAAFRDSGEYL
jgi:hypothetical protein